MRHEHPRGFRRGKGRGGELACVTGKVLRRRESRRTFVKKKRCEAPVDHSGLEHSLEESSKKRRGKNQTRGKKGRSKSGERNAKKRRRERRRKFVITDSRCRGKTLRFVQAPKSVHRKFLTWRESRKSAIETFGRMKATRERLSTCFPKDN